MSCWWGGKSERVLRALLNKEAVKTVLHSPRWCVKRMITDDVKLEAENTGFDHSPLKEYIWHNSENISRGE